MGCTWCVYTCVERRYASCPRRGHAVGPGPSQPASQSPTPISQSQSPCLPFQVLPPAPLRLRWARLGRPRGGAGRVVVEDGKLEGPRDLPLDQLQCQLANGHQRCGRSRAAAGGWRLLLLGPLLGWQRGGRHLWPAAAAGGGIRRSCCCCCRCCWRCCWRYSRAGMLGCCQGALGGDVARSAQEQRRGSSTGAGGGGGVCVGGGQSHVVLPSQKQPRVIILVV